MVSSQFKIKLKGKTATFIDWANVYGWKKSLKREISVRKLYKYLRAYKEVKEMNFYFGTDKNEKSRDFIKTTRHIGYKVVTKPVKYILTAEIQRKKIYRRKCDFDMEISIFRLFYRRWGL